VAAQPFKTRFGHPNGKQLHHPNNQQRECVGNYVGQNDKQPAAGEAAMKEALPSAFILCNAVP
jgi:hypothetical protein